MPKIPLRLTALVLTTLAHILMPAPAHAMEFLCFRDVAEFRAFNLLLPQSMWNGELYAIHESGMLTGALHIAPERGRFVLEVHGVLSFVGARHERRPIASVCIRGTTLAVRLTDGRVAEIETSSDALYYQGFHFTPTDAAGYRRVARVVSEMTGAAH